MYIISISKGAWQSTIPNSINFSFSHEHLHRDLGTFRKCFTTFSLKWSVL